MTVNTSDQQIGTNAQPDYQLFVLGDSLSDTGNLFRATAGLIPPGFAYSEGRFSNGTIAVETLAQQLGLTLAQDTNFAIGGARTNRTNNFDSVILKPGGLLDEIDRFNSQASSLGAGAEDLYLVWAGANDFLSLFSDPTATVNAAVANVAAAVTALAQAGAKNIVVAKTPNLGRTPFAVQEERSQSLTDVSIAFNAALDTTLTALEGTLGGANIILTDLFQTGETIAQNPAAFGFSNATSSYLNGLLPADPSADPSQFFFWDDVHPTTRGHNIFANTFRRTIITNILEDTTRVGTDSSDRLVGFGGNDRLNGSSGDDFLEGNGGNDALYGGSQADTLVGGAGSDGLIGGGGQDLLRGGLGRDRFIYVDANQGRDTITDFQVDRDIIDLTNIVNQPNYQQLDRVAAYIRLVEVTNGTVVRVDANGDTPGGFQPLALIENIAPNQLTPSNFGVTR